MRLPDEQRNVIGAVTLGSAQPQTDCDTCRNDKSGGYQSCPRIWEHIACSQAAELNRQAKRIRELIRECDHEKDQAGAAYDLAEQYARKVGVDVDRVATLRYVEEYWKQRGNFEKDWTDLETLRWDVWQLILQIENGLRMGPNGEPAPADGLSGRLMSERVRDWLKAHPNLGGKSRRRPDLFARPPAPGTLAADAATPNLFGGVA